MIGTLVKGIGSLAAPITQLAGAFRPNAEAEAGRSANELSEARKQFAAEFGHATTWWDSLIDGLNRLPRPLFAFGTAAYLYLSWGNPVVFAEINYGLSTVPGEMWALVLGVFGFYFTLRTGERIRFYKTKENLANALVARHREERLKVKETNKAAKIEALVKKANEQ